MAYKISVADPEDGTTGAGISCDDVKVTISLGHDEHAHGLSQQTGCEGTFTSGLTSGHGPEANTFTVLGVEYTDKGGPGGILPLTGRAQAILQPKTKQAEFFSSTGRIAGGATGGDAGVTTEDTTDSQGGGKNIGFIEDGDYVSYKPFNLKNVSSMRFRVASDGDGGTIEVHVDAPDGPLVATTATIAPTGGWQTFTDVSLALANPPSGTHELFLVFRNPGSTNSLMNLNWIEFVGKGAAVTAAPEVSIVATPTTGTAPLAVAFDSTATDPESTALTYAWDFGVPGTNTDTSTEADPSFTYQQPGTYTATLIVTDADGGVTTKTALIKVNPSAQCPTGYRDDFDGGTLDPSWEVVRRDQTLTLSGGTLNLVAQAGDVYQAANDAKNLVLRPAPEGEWTATTKINFHGLVQYQQAGLLIYGDDDNYTKFDRVATNSATGTNAEKFEFINEVAGTPRNAGADATANLGATLQNDYYLRVKSDGTQITGQYSLDGETWIDVGRAADLPANAKIGVFALSNAAATTADAKFDWLTIDGPGVESGGGGSGDAFDGPTLDKTRWNAIVREDASLYTIENGGLTVTTAAGDIYQTGDSSATRNFILQTADHAGADYVLETKLSGTLAGGYSQGGILVYTDDDNYVKLDAISDSGQTRINRLELRSEVGAAVQDPQPQFNVPDGTTNIWLRLTKAGTSYSGEYSFDGETWTSIGAAVTHSQTAPRFGLYTLGNVDPGIGKTVTFDYFKVDGSLGCGGGGPTNASPVITTATGSPSGGIAPLMVDFSAAATDADGDSLTYSWDFNGDGNEDATGATVSTTYTAAGDMTAKVTVTDGKGGTATKTVPISVLAADDPSAKFRALVFSKTAAFRHDSIPAGITAIKKLGTDNGFQVDATEDASLFRDSVLSHYDVVIWLSTTGDVLTDTQQAAFERFIKAGGGYTGIHSSADTEYGWAWYGQLVGAYFRNHPAGTPTATVIREDKTDPSTADLPDRWERTDEWYNYQSPVDPVVNGGGEDYSPRNTEGIHVLLTMDESTYAEADGSDDVDDDHPISWCHRYDGGRSWYTGLGHTQASFVEAGFLSHLLAGIEIAAGTVDSAACGIEADGNQAPTVTAVRNPSGDVSPGDPVAFTATGTDPDGDTLTYAWDFGDGGSATTKDAMHTYTAVGVFYAKVTVSDGKGGKASALVKVTVQPDGGDNEVEVGVGGVVPGVLSLSISGSANFGAFMPGVTRDYMTSLAATATSSATAAELTVRDPSSQARGHLVNGSSALEQALEVRATDAANPDTAFAPLPATTARLPLLAFGTPVSAHPLTIGFKQSIAATESLNTGGYGKTLVFTLSATTP